MYLKTSVSPGQDFYRTLPFPTQFTSLFSAMPYPIPSLIYDYGHPPKTNEIYFKKEGLYFHISSLRSIEIKCDLPFLAIGF